MIAIADWSMRGRHADGRRLVNFASLPSGIAGITALVVGFVVSIPFQNSSLGYSWGGPFNYITANYLHGADIAYYVGGIVAAVVYLLMARRSVASEA